MSSRIKRICWMVLAVFALVYLLCDWRPLFVNPLVSKVRLRLSVCACPNERGDLAVLDTSGRRMVLLSQDCKVRGILEQGVTQKDFHCLTGIALTEERLYLLDAAVNASGKIFGNRLLEYSLDGEYLGTLHEVAYTEKAEFAVMAYGLKAYRGRLYFVARRDGHWAVMQFADGNVTEHLVMEEAGGQVRTSWYFPEDDCWFLSYTDGRLARLRQGNRAETLPNARYITDMARDGAGRYYLTDSGGQRILSMSSDKTIQVFQERNAYFVGASGDHLATCSIREDGVRVQTLSTGAETVLDVLGYAFGYRLRSVIAWLSLGYLLAFGLCLTAKGARRRLVERKGGGTDAGASEPPLQVVSLYAQNAVVLGIAFVLVTMVLTVDFARQLHEQSQSATRSLAWSLSELSPLAFGDLVKEINGAEDYGKEPYKRMRYVLDTFCRGETDFGFNFSCIVFRILPDGRAMSVISPLERIYHTGKILCAEEEKAFRIRERLEQLRTEPLVDTKNAEVYLVVVPIYDSGKKLVALAYLGYDARFQTQKILEHLQGQSLNLLTLFMLLLLVFGEVRLLWEFHGIRQENLLQGRANQTICEAHRTIRVMYYLLYALTLAFLPTLCQDSAKAAGLDGSFYATLPISIYFASSYIVTMLTQGITQYSPRRAGFISCALFGLGYLGLVFFACHENYWMLFPFVGLCGIGVGVLCSVCSNIVASGLQPRPRYRLLVFKFMEALIGCGIGISAGAFLYEKLGLKWVGIAGVLLSCCLIHLFREFIHADINVPREAAEDKRSTGEERDALRFFLRPRMLAIAGCVALPVMALSSFEGYVLPMYNTSLGNSVLLVGLAGLVIKFSSLLLTDTLFEGLQKIREEARICICAGVSVVGAFIFGCSTSIVSILFLIFAASLCRPVLDTCREEIALESARRAGVNYNRAAKYFIIGESLADTFGPMVFLTLISLGYSFLGVAIAMALAILLFIFAMVNYRRLRGRRWSKSS